MKVHLSLLALVGALLAGCDGGSIILGPDGSAPASDGGLPADAGADARSDGSPSDVPATDGRVDARVTVPQDVAVSNPCMSVPTTGECMSPTTVRFCQTDTNSATPDRLSTFTCPTGTACMVTGGRARCVTSGACREGTTRCANANTLERCMNGMPVATPCPEGCSDMGLTAACRMAVPRAGAMRTFTVVYELREIAADYNSWRDPIIAAAQDFIAVLLRGDQILDAARTQLVPMAGRVQFQLPATIMPTDRIVVLPAKFRSPSELAYVVMKPGVARPAAPATIAMGSAGAAPPNPQLWGWEFPLSSLPADDILRIREADGAGAAHLFNEVGEYLRAYETIYRATALPFVVWFEYDTDWDCGICVNATPATVTLGGVTFAFGEQGYIPGGRVNRRYYADAVLGHEWGHWIMESFGRAPGEGGPHAVGGVSFPGLAWSEGWATWLSSDHRESPIYYDVQGNGFYFHFDIERRIYRAPSVPDGGAPQDASADAPEESRPPWYRPIARDERGELLSMQIYQDENDVAAILYDLASGDMSARLYAALASPRMTQTRMINGVPRFERLYTRRTWEGATIPFANVVDTGLAAPFLGDFLDALNCAGYPRDRLDRATVPTMFYPYPTAMPLCR